MALERGCPAARSVVAPFGRAVEQVSGSDHENIIPSNVWGADFDSWLSAVLAQIEKDDVMMVRPSIQEMSQVTSWLEERRPPDIS